MNDDIKKELDQIGDLVDSKIEKAFMRLMEVLLMDLKKVNQGLHHLK